VCFGYMLWGAVSRIFAYKAVNVSGSTAETRSIYTPASKMYAIAHSALTLSAPTCTENLGGWRAQDQFHNRTVPHP